MLYQAKYFAFFYISLTVCLSVSVSQVLRSGLGTLFHTGTSETPNQLHNYTTNSLWLQAPVTSGW